jgi:hypothetical protein
MLDSSAPRENPGEFQAFHQFYPGGRMPPSTAAKMAAATIMVRGQDAPYALGRGFMAGAWPANKTARVYGPRRFPDSSWRLIISSSPRF